MFGAVVKTWFAEKNGLAPEKIFSVALMPCTAKKVEVALPGMSSNPGVPDMDASLTTREFARMIAQSDIDVEALEDVPLDDPLDKGTGAGVIFGTTGGVMTAALRTAAAIMTGSNPEPTGFEFAPAAEGPWKEAVFDLAGTPIRCAVVHGLANADQLIAALDAGTVDYDFIEVMACPSGCAGGGGQPIDGSDRELGFARGAVLHTLDKLRKEGFDVTLLDVHEDGVVRVEDVAAAIRDDTALVSVMFANNEIGTLQPVQAIGALCRERGVPFHTDAVQAIGHVPVNVQEMNIDMLSCSAHKFHGPRGVGFLYARRGIPLTNIIEGGAQERGKRGGTENTPAIAGMTAALREAVDHMDENMRKVTRLRETLITGLETIAHARLNGERTQRVPGTVNFCFEGIEGESLLLLLDRKGIAASSGSACTSGSLDPSHVLLALGLPHEVAHGSLRLSVGEYNTDEEMAYIVENVRQVVDYLRSISPVWDELETGVRPHQI